MSQFRFIHLSCNSRGIEILEWPNAHQKLEAYLSGVAGDWYRYAPFTYILWSNKDLSELTTSIPKLSGLEQVYVFATEFNTSQYSGWMPKRFWDWLSRPRLQYPFYAPLPPPPKS